MRLLKKHSLIIEGARTAEVRGVSGGLVRAETGLRSAIECFIVAQKGHFVKTTIGYKRARKWNIYAPNDSFTLYRHDHVYLPGDNTPYSVTNVIPYENHTEYECEDLG